MNIKTIEKILKKVVTEWSNDCEAIAISGNENADQKYTNIFSQTTEGAFEIYNEEIYNKYDIHMIGDYDGHVVIKGTTTKVSESEEKEWYKSFGNKKLDTPKAHECYFSFWKDKDGYKISLDGKPSWEYLSPSSDFYSSKFDSIFSGAFEKANIEFDWEDGATLSIYK
jgi:hypothetical protein|tara:strand:- start:36 stop:539 length:504 start_codon:yes stop_codon:yes gene_type:complete